MQNFHMCRSCDYFQGEPLIVKHNTKHNEVFSENISSNMNPVVLLLFVLCKHFPAVSKHENEARPDAVNFLKIS